MASPLLDKIKLYLFPGLASLLGLLIWTAVNDVKQELKAVREDMKILMAQSNIDKTRIDNLERVVYNGNLTTNRLPEKKPAAQPAFLKIVAVKPEDRISPQADPAKRAL
jgi:hypothetical protein